MKLRRMAVGLAAALAAGLTTACAPPDPIGTVDWATGGYGRISVAGWAVDPDGGAAPVLVHAYVDGALVGAAETSVERGDVAALYPGHGVNLGYGLSFAATEGSHRVCVYALNINEGSLNPELGCRVVAVIGDSPFGVIEVASRSETEVIIRGWVADRDATDPTSIGVTLNGVEIERETTDIVRSDVPLAYPFAGEATGFVAQTFMYWDDEAVMCITARNQGSGADQTIGCVGGDSDLAFIDSPRAEPFGNLFAGMIDVMPTAGGFLARSLAVDFWASDEGSPVPVQFTYERVQATFENAASFGVTRGGTSSSTDFTFSEQVAVRPGEYHVCMVVSDQAIAGARTVDCAEVEVT
jgi:hypothetical protein